LTQDEIIAMLRASCDKDKVDPEQNGFWVIHTPELEAFAKLVAQHEREACAVAAEKESLRGLPEEQPEGEELLRACAQIAGGVLIADAIRARGNHASP
jgi:hypothetical protein